MFNELWIKYKDMRPIKGVFKSISYLLIPKTGFISSYLQTNENSIASLLRVKSILNK